MPRPFAPRSAGAVAAVLALFALGACSKGTLIGSGPLPTPTPVVPSVASEFAVPTANSAPTGIALATDGFLYVAENAGNKIAKMTTGGAFTEFAVPTAGAGPFGVYGTADGNVWFTEKNASQIGVLTTAQSFVEYPLPFANEGPTYITLGPDGALYFSETSVNKLGRIDLNGNITEFGVPVVLPLVCSPVCANAGMAGLAGFSDGSVWIALTNTSQLARFDTRTRTFGTLISTPTANSGPTQIVVCPNGQSLCFTENNVAKLGQITPAGVITEHSLSPATSANALVNGADFNIYFTDPAQNKFGQVSGISFGVKEFPITTAGAQPSFMSLGGDGQIYFTETAVNKVARLTYF